MKPKMTLPWFVKYRIQFLAGLAAAAIVVISYFTMVTPKADEQRRSVCATPTATASLTPSSSIETSSPRCLD